MKAFSQFVCATLFAFSAAAASAQTVGIATTPAGSFTNSAGTAIAKVIVDHTDIQARVQPQAGHAMPAVESGAIEFGITNYYDMFFFVTGVEDYLGQGRHENLRVVSNVVPLLLGIMVRNDSDIMSIDDLRGKRIGSGFGSQLAVDRAVRMYLATSEMTYDDVITVPAQNVVAAADDFKAGKTDAFLFALGSGKVMEVAASVGGVRVLPSRDDPQAVDRAEEIVPGAYPFAMSPSPSMEEIAEPLNVYAADLVLFGNKDVPDDTVYDMVKAMHEHKDEMASIFPALNGFQVDDMGKPYDGVEYHPGAIRFYKEQDIWQGE